MTEHKLDPATEKVIASINDEELAARYPDKAHFISAGNPDQGEMATKALFAGEPVVLVYPDGRETLFSPEQVRGVAGLVLLAAVFLMRHRRRREVDVVQLPPRVRIEARDSSGHPIAA